jgi:RNA polymerase sigma factor (sigma-70 family)
VQQTWLAAIESPPTASPRGWLARVVRNAAFQSHRAASRRARHESAAPPRAEEPSPAETVARADAHRRVVDAVMALDEPYRTSVLLRFFEGLESADVARRTGVPVETARTRIKRALALLRGRLDRDAGGDGRAWALALVPLFGAGNRGVPVAAGAATAAAGGAVMAGTAKAAVAGVVGALLGAALTWSAIGIRPPAAHEVAEAAPAAAAPQGASAEPRRAPSARTDGVSGRPAADATTPRVPLDELVASVNVDTPRRGTGTISGRVLTTDGRPLPGAIVRAQLPHDPAERRWRRGRVPALPTVESSVRAAIEGAKWVAATLSEATTDASGAYTLRGLADVPYRVGAWLDGYDIRLVNVSDGDDLRPGATVDFAASALGEVPVTVLLPDGSSPERANVRWSAPRGSTSAWWFRDSATLAIDIGEWSLAAELGNDLRAAPVNVTVAAGRGNAPVVLQLVARNVITGIVRLDPADAGWDSLQVGARRRGATEPESDRTCSTRSPHWKFRIEDVEPGDYEVSVSIDGGARRLASASVRVSGGAASVDLDVPKFGAALVVGLRVLAPDGAEMASGDFDVTHLIRQSNGYAEQGTRCVRMTDGSLRVVLGAARSSDERAQHFLCVRSRTYGRKEVAIVPGTTERVEVAFSEAARAEVTLSGAEGTPLADRLRVTLRPKSQDDAGTFINAADTPDRPFEPGEYVARLWIVGTNGQPARVLTRTPVNLRTGTNAIALRVPDLFRLTLRVPGAARGTTVYLSSARRPDRPWYVTSCATSDDGAATFDELPAGSYVASVTIDGEMREMVVRVASDGAQTFAPTTISGLAVTVEDAAGALAAWGLASGDVIVAIDRTPIDTVARADALMLTARGHQFVELDVRRGGRSVTLTVDPGRLAPVGDRGGWWEPVVR